MLRLPIQGGDPGLIPGQGTRFHMLQVTIHIPKLKKIRHATTKGAATKTQYNKREEGKKVKWRIFKKFFFNIFENW